MEEEQQPMTEEVPEQPAAEQAAKPAAGGDRNQNIVQRLVMAAMKMVYSTPQATQSFIGLIAKGGDPASGLAQATALVINQLKSQVKGINPGMVLMIAPAVLAMLAELAVKAKVMPEDPKILDAALQELRGQLGVPSGGQKPAPAPAPQEEPQGQPGLIAQGMEA